MALEERLLTPIPTHHHLAPPDPWDFWKQQPASPLGLCIVGTWLSCDRVAASAPSRCPSWALRQFRGPRGAVHPSYPDSLCERERLPGCWSPDTARQLPCSQPRTGVTILDLEILHDDL